MPYRQAPQHEDKPATGPVRVAPSLREARPNDLLWLDRDGNVRAMTWLQRVRFAVVLVVLPLGLLACVALAAFSESLRVFGIVMGLVYLFFGAAAYWSFVARGALERAARGQAREASAMADRILAHHVMAAGFQRVARLIKARTAGKQGRWPEAIEQYRAIRYTRAPRRSSVLNRLAEVALFEEIVALCNADRRDDAKELLARAARPAGDFLTLLHDTARLAVAFTTDDPSVVPAEDVKKMIDYEHLAMGWGVLALVGWHARKTGDEALARRAVDAERGKPHGDFERRMPAVARWLDQA